MECQYGNCKQIAGYTWQTIDGKGQARDTYVCPNHQFDLSNFVGKNLGLAISVTKTKKGVKNAGKRK
jgi:hypothetical protein